MKILELYFILFSKLYVKFSHGKEDWFYLPLFLISFISCLNIFIVSLLCCNSSPYYILGLVFLCFFGLILLCKHIKIKGKDYVRKYVLIKKILFLLILLLFIDFYGLVKILNYTTEININLKRHQQEIKFSNKRLIIKKLNYVQFAIPKKSR